ncbi:MAG: hypothetical protein ACOX3U_03640 [Christensenellales bacterium]|jgi:hypothetical protein
MWQTIISIDKNYVREYEFIIGSLNKINGLAYAPYDTKSRHHINIAANEEDLKTVKVGVNRIITDTVLIYIKYSYLTKNIHFNEESYLNSALISALVYCDRNHETMLVENILNDVYEYSIDALFKFRMGELKSNWDEVIMLVNGLIHSNHTPNDIYSLIQFILEMSDDKKSLLKISRGDNESIVIENITSDKKIDIPKLSERDHTNIISAIISANPYEIQLEKELLNNEMINVVNNIVRLKTI